MDMIPLTSERSAAEHLVDHSLQYKTWAGFVGLELYDLLGDSPGPLLRELIEAGEQDNQPPTPSCEGSQQAFLIPSLGSITAFSEHALPLLQRPYEPRCPELFVHLMREGILCPPSDDPYGPRSASATVLPRLPYSSVQTSTNIQPIFSCGRSRRHTCAALLSI